MWQLVINGPGYFDTVYDLPDGVTHLGRADENDIVLSGDLVSRRHARLTVKQDGITFEDLGSRNGTKVNGEAFVGVREVKGGDTLGVGENTLVLRRPAAAENAATEMLDTSSNGIRGFGKGVDIGQAVMLARDIRDSVVLRVLDNVLPFESPEVAPPVPSKVLRKPSDTDETPDRRRTGELEAGISSDGPSGVGPVAWQSLVAMYKVAERLATAPSLQVFLDDAADVLIRRVAATTCVVLLRHRTGVLVPSAVRHSRPLGRGEVPVSEAIVETALRQGQAIAVADVRDDSRFADRESVMLYQADQVLCVPIGMQSPFLGVLYLNRPSTDSEPVEALLDICTAITQLLASGIEKFNGRPDEGDRLRKGLERFHAPETVERRLKDMGGKASSLDEKAVTALRVEIADFAELLKKLAPDRLADVLSELHKLAVKLVFSFDGTIERLTGGSLHALFGTPYSRGDDAIRAVRCAMALKAEWERLSVKRPPRERCTLRIGLSSGRALAGTIGADGRVDHVSVGEPLMVAELLCQTAEASQVLMTGKTLALVGARFDVTPLGERALQGSRLRTAVFEVLEEDNETGTLSGVRPSRRTDDGGGKGA